MSLSHDAICAFLYREVRLLDDREWDDRLTCYAPDVTCRMPAWDDDDQIIEDPHSQISLIFYPSRDGLEDRVFRIKTERSGASTPEPRTSHNVTNVEVLAVRENEADAAAPAPAFLPGQYVNIDVPGTGLARSYSFSTAPGERRIGFLIKKIPGGVMSGWLARAKPGDRLDMTGPLGGFYLRDAARPLLLLAGGTGLAPFFSMLEMLARQGSSQTIHVIYGVTRDLDLVLVEEIERYAARLPNFSFSTVVAEEASTHPRKGWVTQHMPADVIAGDLDTYLCGPPPMVDAVRRYFEDNGVKPASFHYEKFTPNAPLKASA